MFANKFTATLRTTKGEDNQETINYNNSNEFNLKKRESTSYFQTELKWLNIVIFLILHFVAIFGLITFPYLRKKRTFLFGKVLGVKIKDFA